MSKIKVLIADDHKIVRDGIRLILDDQSDFKVAGEASNGEEVLEEVRDREVDIIIMDINMPRMDGITCTQKVKQENKQIRVLALTMLDEDEHIRNMIRAGASGFVLKQAGQDELIEALKTISEGRHYFSDKATYSIVLDLMQSEKQTEETGKKKNIPLTKREKQVLCLICREMTNQEIAKELYISVRTVDAHRRNLLQKTGARNTAGLVRYALENNLVDDFI